jgi:hypothetical protein
MVNGVLLLEIALGLSVLLSQVIVPCAQRVNTAKPPRRHSQLASALRDTIALLVARLLLLWLLLVQPVASAQQVLRPRLHVLRAHTSQQRLKVPVSSVPQATTALKAPLARLLVELVDIAQKQLAQRRVSRAQLAPTAAVGQEPLQLIVCLVIQVAIARAQAKMPSRVTVQPDITVP